MRTPHWRRQGAEPDYRFSLANERTFLAWIRTALALLAGGVLLEQFAVELRPQALMIGLSVTLAALAAVLCGGAYLRWKANEIAMRHAQPLPHSVVLPVTAAATLLAAAVLAVITLLK